MRSSPSIANKRLPFIVAGLFVVALAIVGLSLALPSPTFTEPGGAYAVRYPRDWQASAVGGVVTFQAKDPGRDTGARVTIVLSRLAGDWPAHFEDDLAKGFAALGARYALRGKDSLTVAGAPVTRYRYDLELAGKAQYNTVLVYALAPDKAAVMTCTALRRDDPQDAAHFAVFYPSLRPTP